MMGVPMATSQDFVNWVCGPELEPRYLKYVLQSDREALLRFANGSTHQTIYFPEVKAFHALLPNIEEQHEIVATLGALDEKIESNRRASNLLIEIAMAKYRVACEKGDRVVMVDEVAQFYNRKRIPLSSQQRNDRPGPYPYYGATGVFGYVDDFLFNEILVLVGEDGSVVNDDGTPVTQYIWGKSWINNHAHPLTGRGVSTELLYLALKNVDVRPLVTGAVQLKINMGNLKRLKLRLPQDESTRCLELELQSLFASYRQLADEIKRLRDLRDTLLPELLSGRVRITEALKVQA